MGTLREAWSRVWSFFQKRQRDTELDAELKAHLELAVEDNVNQGMPLEEARRRALVRFGGVQQAKEQQRESRGLPWLDILLQDLRYTMRTLRRDRGFAVVAVLILALGIGANIVVFSVVNTILLRPLPFQDPQRLVWIAPADASGLSASTYSADAYDDLLAQNRSYEDVTGYYAFSTSDNLKLAGRGDPTPVTGIGVVGNFFHVLGVEPELGRGFTADEARKGGRAVVLLSHPFWQRQFGGDRAIVGKAITLSGVPTTVVGVLPETFDFGAAFSPGTKVDVYVPTILDEIRDEGNTLALIGRLKPGASVAQAQAEATVLFPKFFWSKKYPDSAGNYTARPIELKQYVSGKLRRSLNYVVVRRGADPSDRVREPVESIAGSSCGAEQRICLAQCAGSRASASGTAAFDGEPRTGWGRCGVRSWIGVWDHFVPRAPGVACPAVAEQREGRWCGTDVDADDQRWGRGFVWAAAGVEDVEQKSTGGVEGHGAGLERWQES
jgi:hypothetical protein